MRLATPQAPRLLGEPPLNEIVCMHICCITDILRKAHHHQLLMAASDSGIQHGQSMHSLCGAFLL